MAAKILKYCLWGLILIILVLPSIQLIFPLVLEKKLQGNVVYADEPTFSWESWFNGTYQNGFNQFTEDHIGLRSYFVRLNNQYNYTIFRKFYARDIILGQDRILYAKPYLDEFYGVNFRGKDAIEILSCKIKFIQDSLLTKGIVFVPIFAPGKASFYSNHYPKWYYEKHEKSLNNYDYFIKMFDSLHITNIDFTSLFLKWKDTSSHILIPKYGIHWSSYGAALVVDSMQNFFSKQLDTSLVDVSWDKVEKSLIPREDDNDIVDGLNLIFPFKLDDSLSYPNIQYYSQGKFKPDVLTIADSYYWQIFGTGISKRLYNRNDFWFYNYKEWSFESIDGNSIDRAFLNEKIFSYNIIFTLYTERNFKTMANDFINQAYCALKYMDEVNKIIDGINSNQEWYNKIKEKSDGYGIPVEKQIWLDAFWMVTEKYKNKL